MQTWLRYALLAGIFAVPFIPFLIANSMFFPFITGKNFAFRILVELMLGAWIVLAVLDVRYRPKLSWLLGAIAAWVAVIFFADLFGENAFKSFWSNFERMEGWITLIHLLAYFIVVGTVLNTEKLWGWFAGTTIGASVIMGFYGLFQLADFIDIRQGGDRLDGTFGNATYLAVYMLFHIFITALLLAKWRAATWVRVALVAVLAFQLFILIQTATRGAIIGVVGGAILVTVLIALFERTNRQLRRIAAGTLAVLVILVGGFFAVKDTQFVRDISGIARVATISLDEQTVRSRFMVWDMAWQGVKEKPILGWGQESFNYVFNKYYNPKMFDQEPWFDRVHNIVGDWLIAGGVLGFLAYVSMPLIALWYLWFHRRRGQAVVEAQQFGGKVGDTTRKGERTFSITEAAIFTGMLAAYGFYNFFTFDNIGSYLLFFGVLAYIHFRVTPALPSQSWLTRSVPVSVGTTIIAPIVLVVTLLGVYVINIPAMGTSTKLIQALSPGAGGNIERNIERWEELLDRRTIGRQEVREQLIQFAGRVVRNDSYSLQEQQTVLDLATMGMNDLLGEVGEDARLYAFQGSFLNNAGFPNEARPYLEKAVELSPTKPDMIHALATTYLATEDFDQALALYKRAFELAPEYDLGRIRYAAAAVFAGQDERARELLEEEFGTTIVNNRELLRAYSETGQLEKVLAIWQLRVKENPNDPQSWLSLAATHMELGDREAAIDALERFKEVSPENADRADFFIQEIRAGRTP